MSNRQKSKHIAVLVQNLRNGGAERMAANLSLALEADYKVTMIVFDAAGAIYPCCKELIDLKVPPLTEGSSVRRIFNTLQRVRKLRYLKRKLSIDTTISHMDGANLVNLLSGMNDRKITVYHSMPSMESGTGFVHKCFHRLIGAGSYRYLTVSKPAQKDMQDNFGVSKEKVQCLYNFVDLKKARERMGEALDLKVQAFFDTHKKIIVHAGRLIPLKAQCRLIRVLAEIRKEGHNAGLVILGEGEERQKLAECAKEYGVTEHVYMPGEIKNPFAYFKRSHVFVLCSEYEGLPMVLIEALACGCPVVSVDMTSGAREILAPDTGVTKKATGMEYAKYGILTPQYTGEGIAEKNEQLLKQAVSEMLYEDRIRSRYLQSCAEGAERFSKDTILEQWRELIEE